MLTAVEPHVLVILVALILLGAIINGLVAMGFALLAVGGALWGSASGAFLAVDWALMTDIIPRASAGRYMGLSNVATASSAVFGAAIGGLVMDAVNVALGVGPGPRAAFAVAAVLYVAAAVLLRPVVEPPRRTAPAA